MLSNLVEETANNPGTSTDVNLGGAPTGRRTFAQEFSNGDLVLYGITDGSSTHEAGIGTFVAGSPNVLQRTTVLWNSAGTTARLNFPGACRVYNEVPSQQMGYFNDDDDFLLKQDPTVALGAAPKQYVDARLLASAVSAYGLTLIDDANAAAARSTLGVPALPTTSGVGLFELFVSTSGGAATLPAGGSWAFFIQGVVDSTLTWSAVRNAGVAAGGSVVGGAVAGLTYVGFRWRIT